MSVNHTPLLLCTCFIFFFFFFFMELACSDSPAAVRRSNFNDNFMVSWAPRNVKFLGSGDSLQLLLDQNTGSGFASKHSYLFGTIHMEIKLIPGDSAGTVTAYYMSSESANHDELDFEFLGNKSGQPYILQTNVYSNGVGGREQRIYLWFDPTADFHTYTVSWSQRRVVMLVDGVPIRVFSDNKAAGVPYLDRQAMRVYSSIWNGDSWATQGGAVKIDWTQAPFVATYRNFRAKACRAGQGGACDYGRADNSFDRAKLAWVKRRFMTYDYCRDVARYPVPPPECSRESLDGFTPDQCCF